MQRLEEMTFLFLDCQTTGMRPSQGSLLEMAWGFGRALDPELKSLHSKIIQLPEGETIPDSIQELTGIRPTDLDQAQTLPYLFSDFMTSWKQEHQIPLAIIHYAQFEKPFLEDLFLQMTGESILPFRIFCSQKLARRLFPQLPSQNLRGLSGFFGRPLHELKRASSHVRATFEIWKSLVEALKEQNVFTLQDLENWMQLKSAKPKIPYEYRISREQRLGLPERPGIYRMKAKNGETLYVGKATSLRDRVNSYFRGRKGRDPRKLEMLTQVWDLEVTETETALEAALLENDEIKRLNPPYNVSLKARDRKLLFYSRDFESSSSQQSDEHPLGPFRPSGALEQIHILSHSLKVGAFLPLFYEPIALPILREGFEIFCQRHGLRLEKIESMRSLLAFGSCLLRQLPEEEPDAEMESEPKDQPDLRDSDEEDVEVSPEEVSHKFERLLIHGARELRRSRRLTRLLNAHVEWESEIGWKSLDFREGRLQPHHSQQWSLHPWRNLGILEYDRMSVLLSEISRKTHRISTFLSSSP